MPVIGKFGIIPMRPVFSFSRMDGWVIRKCILWYERKLAREMYKERDSSNPDPDHIQLYNEWLSRLRELYKVFRCMGRGVVFRPTTHYDGFAYGIYAKDFPDLESDDFEAESETMWSSFVDEMSKKYK